MSLLIRVTAWVLVFGLALLAILPGAKHIREAFGRSARGR